MDLFEYRNQTLKETEAPLAARMRPQILEEFVGQTAILGPGRLLRRAIQADQLSSLIFYGPPGTGKTTLAQIIANTSQAHFIAMNAVLAGVKEIRSAIETAQRLRGQSAQKTILFVDEVHRFNKAQQDALLPWVENGTVILIGATTENPYFEVNKALVSRSRIFQLQALSEADLKQVAHHALTDAVRGYGQRSITVSEEALQHWVNVANGDARTLLNALELAVETTEPNETGIIAINLAIAEASIQRRAVLYDKEGDVHFDTISAFIKSLRGSDPDAALYWLARMVYAGEDPRFILRRMLIFASEDVGLADPQAIAIINACAQGFDRIGLPEGQYPLAQAALYLAMAPKSNSVLGYFDALAAIEQERESEVPNHLKDKNRDQQGFGHGVGYQYPHAYRDHWVAQQYLPAPLQGQVFYQPSGQGAEGHLSDRLNQQREAQLAAILEGNLHPSAEVLSFSPINASQEKWLQRTISQTGQQLANIRTHLFELAQLERHHVVIDLQARSGLLLWEALRQTPEGGVYARVTHLSEAEPLQQQAQRLSTLQRPIFIAAPLLQTPEALAAHTPGLSPDCLLGRHLFKDVPSDQTMDEFLGAIALLFTRLLSPHAQAVLCETLPQGNQRLYQLLNPSQVKHSLYQAWQDAEEAFYSRNPGNSPLSWGLEDVKSIWSAQGLTVTISQDEHTTAWQITPQLLARWFNPGGHLPSYGDRLSERLTPHQLEQVRSLMQSTLLHQTIQWRSQLAYLTIRLAPK